MSKRGENIYKRKDGRWEGRYIKDRTVGGKAIYGYVYAYSYKETRTKLQDAIRDWHSSEQTCQEETETTDFQSLAEEWFRHMEPLVNLLTENTAICGNPISGPSLAICRFLIFHRVY